MLIRRADLGRATETSIRIVDGRIAAIDAQLVASTGEDVFDARGAAVLPGLHDHHIHLLALAAALDSVPCGPPQHRTADALAAALRAAAAERGGSAWLRGIGYHESVAGDIDRDALDVIVSATPMRIQHRSGQLWILNSRALEVLGLRDDGGDDPFERRDGRLTGRLYGADHWLRERLGSVLPDLRHASRQLARRGVTGVTDASPGNGLREFAHIAAEQARKHLLQDVLMMGGTGLDAALPREGLGVGPTKLYLREAALPPFEALCSDIARSHAAGRAVAMHCVTLAELVFGVAAVQHCGAHPGDRIEHASLCSPEAVALLKSAGLRVVTQPHFVFERGDAYLADVPAHEIGWLYRGRSFLDAGVALAAGSDAPYSEPDPWQALTAAVQRRSRGGQSLGPDEALSPTQALGLFCGDPLRPGEGTPAIDIGARADLCVIDRGWRAMLTDFSRVEVRLTMRRGEPTWIA